MFAFHFSTVLLVLSTDLGGKPTIKHAAQVENRLTSSNRTRTEGYVERQARD